MIYKDSKIYIAGHKGMVGSACLRILEKNGYKNLVGKSSKELDLRCQSDVNDFLNQEKPDVIIDAAAKVGGILANDTYPYEFLMDNMLIQNNLIKCSHDLNVSKFIFLGSSCIYPKMAPQPLKENYLLSGPLESTNEWYAIAKISGLKLVESLRKQYNKDYIALMPTNLYGPGDNFDLVSSHVLPAMIRKFHEAKTNSAPEVNLWGTGSPMREFMHVDDLASAVIFSLENKMGKSLYNVGFGKDLTIKELALIIQEIINYSGEIKWDTSKPDGTPRKLMDSKMFQRLGWKPKITLREGIKETYDWYLSNQKKLFLN
jgi:GDP-L-fucose synthase